MSGSESWTRWPGAPRATPAEGGGRLVAPAAERNKAAIAEAMAARFGRAEGVALEIGAGTGQHAAALSAALPGFAWIPTDPSAEARRSIAAWAKTAGRRNLRPPIALDASGDWAEVAARGPFGLIFAANVIHVAPWAVTEGIFRGAGRCLAWIGSLALYGPFLEDGAHISESNAAFDAQLRAQDPSWGVRDLAELDQLAADVGLARAESVEMPANNRIQIYRWR